MLVPLISRLPLPDPDSAARTACPGPETSGFCRPSRVGPALEKNDIGRAVLCASYDPTDTPRWLHEMLPIVPELSWGGANLEANALSRSIQAWKRPSTTTVPFSRTT